MEENIRIWKAHTSIRNALGIGYIKVFPIYMTDADVRKVALF